MRPRRDQTSWIWHVALAALLLAALGCDGTLVGGLAADDADEAAVDAAGDAVPRDAASPDRRGAPDAQQDAAPGALSALDRGTAAQDAAPPCKKKLTVVCSVGTGCGAVRSLSNGCWVAINADGAATKQYRKCSTSNFVVKNPGAPNYAYDDTNPNRPLSADKSYLAKCSSGATGIGFEYMAYRNGTWRLLTAPHMKAYFAELYSSDQHVWDYYAHWPKSLSGHTVYPMINIGPQQPATIQKATATTCAAVARGGYFGIYNSDWAHGMGAADARAKALAAALNKCTL